MITTFTDLSLYSLHHQPNIKNVCELNPDFDLNTFSRFKYGDTTIAVQYANEFAKALIPQLHKNTLYFLAGSASQNVPTAARSIASELALILCQNGYNVRYFTIFGQSFSQDYSSLNNDERLKMLTLIQPKVQDEEVAKLLQSSETIIIDDIRITGLHQQKLEALAVSNSWKNVLFCYVATLDNLQTKNPQLEWTLNHHYVDCLSKLLEIMLNDHFTFNARVCKFILSAPTKDLLFFIEQLPIRMIETMIILMKSDGYNKMTEYRESFNLIDAFLQQRSQVLASK